jgi:hypothetical protein
MRLFVIPDLVAIRQMPLQPNYKLGPYEILTPIGAGGFHKSLTATAAVRLSL